MRGDEAENTQDVEQPVRRLRLVSSPENNRDAVEPVPNEVREQRPRRRLEAPLTITPPELNGRRTVKRINTLTPPGTPVSRPGTSGESERSEAASRSAHRRESLRQRGSRGARQSKVEVYRRRRLLAAGIVVAVVLAAVAVLLAASFGGGESPPAISTSAPKDTVLAEAGGVAVTTPIRPGELNGLGYHPEGSTLALEPEGRKLGSLNPFSRLPFGVAPEEIRYSIMDRAGREGPRTGALDVGAPAGTEVYSPVTGMITAIRPDSRVSGANVVEIQPSDNPDLRVYVSFVNSGKDGAGVKSPVEAGETKLGAVADSARVLDPQLAEYTGRDGNHVTVAVDAG